MKGKINDKYHLNLTAKVPEQMLFWKLKWLLLFHFFSCMLKEILCLKKTVYKITVNVSAVALWVT